jgi:hypothetical protein
MSDLRKAKLLKNIALKEHARLPPFIQRQKLLIAEAEQLTSLLDRIRTLMEDGGAQQVLKADRLTTDRWYELRLIEEARTLQNKLDFIHKELENVTAAIARMSHKKQHVSEMATQVLKQAKHDRDAYHDTVASGLSSAQKFNRSSE